MQGQSIFISGIGGTGKSHTMKEMVKQLQEKDIHVKIIAKCHVAALNAGQGVKEGTDGRFSCVYALVQLCASPV